MPLSSCGRLKYHEEICGPNSSHKISSTRKGYSFFINMPDTMLEIGCGQ
jgi:hypothetical protein